LALSVTALIFVQLVIGATMRHQHAGLAIPDFPLAYGKVWPSMDSASIAAYNAHRMETTNVNSITSFQVGLQMAHRILAIGILTVVAICTWRTVRKFGVRSRPGKTSLIWLGLVLLQASLGAATIWSNKAADVATAHVVVGALLLANGALLWLIMPRNITAEQATSVATSQTAGFEPLTTAAAKT
jgi:cytochrome c oxidase assembly protein subunit 15